MSRVTLVFSDGKFFGFGFKILIAKDNTPEKHTKGVLLEEEMLLSALMFSTSQHILFTHFFWVPLYINSIFVFVHADFISGYFELYSNHVIAYGCYLLFCLYNPTAVVVGCFCCCGTTGMQVILFIQSLPYCGCSCSHLPCIGSREAARECRRKKKEYVKCLENRVAVLENQNKTLIEELKALKDLYCHKAE